MLKLKGWPSPSASEEFLFYSRPEFISRLPLLEYIHSRLEFLNVAAKLPHYSLQNDVGPKIFMSYGTSENLGRGDSVTDLHFDMHDMVYLLVHTYDVKSKGQQKMEIDTIQKSSPGYDADDSSEDPKISLNEEGLPDLSLGEHDMQNESETKSAVDVDSRMEDQIETVCSFEERSCGGEQSNQENGDL